MAQNGLSNSDTIQCRWFLGCREGNNLLFDGDADQLEELKGNDR
jgi:hypothetical protein